MTARVRRYGFVVGALVVSAVAGAVSVSAQSPTCFGEAATIVAVAGVPTTGTGGADVIVGTNGADHIRGGGGNDLICGRGGNDMLWGNAGADRIRGGGGSDTIRGGRGHDLIVGGPGDDELHGNSGSDTIRGKRGSDRIWGGKGSDTLFGGRGDDVVMGDRGNDRLEGGFGTDRCFGGPGADRTESCELVDTDTGVNPAVAPVGALDLAELLDGKAEVVGWALDRSGGAAQPWVEISANGEVLARFRPSNQRLDLELAYGDIASRAGFRVLVDVPPGAHTLCADVMSGPANARVRLGCGESDPVAASAERAELRALLRKLGRAAEDRLDGTTVAIAVVPFDRGEPAEYRGNRFYISASSAKAWWTAAALANGKARDAATFAPAVFQVSSDAAAGSMIDLAGGIDSVNRFTLEAGMTDTAAIKWIHGGNNRRSEQSPGPLGGSNYVTAGDAAAFFYKLGTYQVLSPEMTDLLAGWMRMSPRDTRTGPRQASTIADSLPPAVQDKVEQKAGWLSPGAFSVPSHLLATGIVHPTNGGPSYAIALMGAGGDPAAYTRLIEFFQSASCQIYVHIAADESWTCPGW